MPLNKLRAPKRGTQDWGGGIALSMGLLRKGRVNKIVSFHPSYTPPKGATKGRAHGLLHTLL